MKTPLLLFAASSVLFGQASVVDRFFDDYYFHFNPNQGTAAGFHQYDTRLEDLSAATRQAQIAAAHRFEKEIETMPASGDRELMLGQIHADLLELESVRMWQRNPDVYSSNIAGDAFSIMSRTYAPPAERMKSLTARERLMPHLLDEAKENLQNPPEIYTSVAIQQLPGIISFFQHEVPAAFEKVTDAVVLKDFHAANDGVISALGAYQKWLQTTVLPESHGDFRIGAENFRKKLEYEEMVDIPLDRLLEIGFADLRRNQNAFKETAAKINPGKTPGQILMEMENDHPAPGDLIKAFSDTLSGLKDYIQTQSLVEIPSPVLPIVENSPPFMRALTTASMDTPGPYERAAKEAFFNVTTPEPDWTMARKEEYMTQFSYPTIKEIAIHEAYPGHYVQFLWMQRIHDKVRKLLGASSNAEGWAHYCEQMMLDEGYGNGDPKLRLGQLHEALLRDARYIVGIEMHTGKMTFEQGIQFFMNEGYQPKPAAEKETKRGTSNPTYLYYTLGKLEILKLRADYQQKMGSKYSIKDFHDQFLQQGFPPIKIVREDLLGPNSGPVL